MRRSRSSPIITFISRGHYPYYGQATILGCRDRDGDNGSYTPAGTWAQQRYNHRKQKQNVKSTKMYQRLKLTYSAMRCLIHDCRLYLSCIRLTFSVRYRTGGVQLTRLRPGPSGRHRCSSTPPPGPCQHADRGFRKN